MHTSSRHNKYEKYYPLSASTLPFVGRDEELGRIVDFFHSTIAADKLALLWLQGEIGIGKSRFLEYVRSELSTEENFILYVRLYPDSASSIIQAIGAAIEGHTQLFSLLPRFSSRTIMGLQAVLRRTARLRPTLLVIDDSHLLSDESIPEIVDLLAGLREEPIAVVCSSRPGVIPSYEALYTYKTASLELHALRLDEVRQLLGKCYGEQVINDVTLRKVYDVTHGIPLVLRAAMTDYLTRPPGQLVAGLTEFPRTAFHTKAQLSINALIACLISNLTKEEEEAIRAFALLGEVFSAETAESLFPGASGIISSLVEKNLLTIPLTQPQLLIAQEPESTKQYYVFAHSLLYEHLLAIAPPRWEELIAVIKKGAPLYSISPLLHIANVPEEWIEAAMELLSAAVEDLADSLNRSLATPVYNAAVALFQRHQEGMNKKMQLNMRLHLLRLRLHLISFIPAHPDFVPTLDEFIEFTENPPTEPIALHRLAALEYSIYQRTEWWELTMKDALDEAESLTVRFPALQTHRRYLKLLGTVAGALRLRPAPAILERIRRSIPPFLGASESRTRRAALEWIVTPLLTVFNSIEEMEDRKEFAQLIRKEYGKSPKQGRLLTAWPQYLESIGDALGARKELEDRFVKPLRGFNLSDELGLRLLGLTSDAAIGRDLATIEREGQNILDEYRVIEKDVGDKQGYQLVRSSIVATFQLIAALRKEYEWGRTASSALCDGSDEEAKKYMRFEIAAACGDEEIIHELFDANVIPAQFRPLASCILSSSSATIAEQALDSARRLLEEPIFRRQDLLRVYTTISLAQRAISTDRIPRRVLKIEIRNALKRGLAWSADNALPGYMRPLLQLAKEFLNQEDYRNWNERLTIIEEQVEAELQQSNLINEEEDPRPRLSMIGSIQVKELNAPPRRISGARVRHVLGLLTANEMTRNNMSLEEFRKLATGMETSQEAANYLRIMISRLRRLLGEESIVNEGESAPRLNIEYLRVDLIEAVYHIEAAISGIRAKTLHPAFKEITQALRIVGDQVILPALFDEIFDNARREFEIRLRQAILGTLDLMTLPEDSEYALLLLRLADQAIPHDDELAEMLTETLRSLGRHVEALNIEHRSQESVED